MSAGMILAVADAPVYAPTKEIPNSGIITDHAVLLTRATDEVLDKLTTLIRSREDGEANLLEESLSEDQLDLFEEDHDNDDDIVARRRELALIVLKDIINQVFPADDGFGGSEPDINNEVTWIWVDGATRRRTLLITGGMSYGDNATEAMPAVSVMDALGLFDEPFLREGAEAPEPEREMTSEELYALNDFLAEQLATRGWNAETDLDYEALNELTHQLAPLQLKVDGLISTFMAANSRD